MKPEQINALKLLREFLATASEEQRTEIHRQVDELCIEGPSKEELFNKDFSYSQTCFGEKCVTEKAVYTPTVQAEYRLSA